MPSLRHLLCLLPLALGVLSKSTADYPERDIDSGKVLARLSKKAYNNAMKRLEEEGTPECNSENVKIFKEWYVAPSPSSRKNRVSPIHIIQAVANLGDLQEKDPG